MAATPQRRVPAPAPVPQRTAAAPARQVAPQPAPTPTKPAPAPARPVVQRAPVKPAAPVARPVRKTVAQLNAEKAAAAKAAEKAASDAKIAQANQQANQAYQEELARSKAAEARSEALINETLASIQSPAGLTAEQQQAIQSDTQSIANRYSAQLAAVRAKAAAPKTPVDTGWNLEQVANLNNTLSIGGLSALEAQANVGRTGLNQILNASQALAQSTLNQYLSNLQAPETRASVYQPSENIRFAGSEALANISKMFNPTVETANYEKPSPEFAMSRKILPGRMQSRRLRP